MATKVELLEHLRKLSGMPPLNEEELSILTEDENEENENENEKISKHKGILLEPVDIPGPTTLLLGKNIKLAAQLTASHTKAKDKVKIKYKNKTISVNKLTRKQIDKLRI